MNDNAEEHSLSPATVARPDLDWSQAREAILMLNLAVAQIEIALKDSSASVDVLAHSFTGMYGNIMDLLEQARALPDSPARTSIAGTSTAISVQMQQAIIAFQFYDRLSQRLSHVSSSLDHLTGIVNDPSRRYDPSAWHVLQQRIRSQYTMEDEKLVFDTLIRTGDVREALACYIEARRQQSGSGAEVELF